MTEEGNIIGGRGERERERGGGASYEGINIVVNRGAGKQPEGSRPCYGLTTLQLVWQK